jgi:26S proteasome regulatory subunit N1
MAPEDKDAVELTASTAEKKKDSDKLKGGKKKDDKPEEDALSEEDQALKERLDTCVSTITNDKKEDTVTIGIRQKALDVIINELRTATSSMTSVPKPLKFLRPHFAVLKALHVEFEGDTKDNEAIEFRARVADVLSVLAMTMGKPGTYLVEVLMF